MGAKEIGWGLKKGGNNSLSHKYKEEIEVVLHKSLDLLTSSILDDGDCDGDDDNIIIFGLDKQRT